MSSAGSAIGGVVGAIAGFFLGGPTGALYGAQIGMSLGGLLDPPKLPDGPRLDDLSVQTSTYGAPIPRVYGTVTLSGNVIWLEGDKIREKKKKSGGKGGPSQTTYKYYGTFAVGLCCGPILAIRRLWLGPNLVYDGDAPTTAGVIKSGKVKSTWQLYTGEDDQTADPRIQADKGIGSTSAYPGLAYLVFYDLPLEKYSNSLAGVQVRAEVITAGTEAWQLVDSATFTQSGSGGSLYKGHAQFVDANGAYWFDPLYSSVSSTPFEYNVNLVSQDLTPRLIGRVTAPIAAGTNYLLVGKVDIPAIAMANTVSGDVSFIVLESGGESRVFYPPQSQAQWHDAGRVRKLGDDFFLTIQTPDGSTPNIVLARYSWANAGYAEVVCQEPRNGVGFADLDVEDDRLYALEVNSSDIYVFDTADLTVLDVITGPLISSMVDQCLCVSRGEIWVYAAGTLYHYANGTWSTAMTGGFSLANEKDVFWLNDVIYVSEANDPGAYVYANRLTPSIVPLSNIVQAECLQSNLLTAADLDVTDLAADSVRGFTLADTAPIRTSLEPLQQVWPFDIRMHGYKIEFVRRGNSSVASIPAADLDARGAEAEPGPLITIPRDIDSQLPQRSILRYLDVDREYNPGEQSAQRYNTDAVNATVVDVPVVLTATEAARAVEILHYTWWRERGADIAFRLPPSYLQLEPADVILVTDSAGTAHVLRLLNINYGADGILECAARRESATAYSSSAVADTGQSTGSGLYIPGPTLAALMDLPALSSTGDGPGFYAGLTGIFDAWPGGTLYGSLDGGQNYAELESSTTATVMGAGQTALGAATCFDRIDAAGTLTVQLYDGELASVTELQMLAGANHFAYGAAGRWEILAAKTIALNGDGTYTLQDFLRGRCGTEQYASTHAGGDLLVLLDADATLFVGLETAQIGASGLFRPVTFGEDLEDVVDITLTYNAENLKPRSPIYLNGSIHPTTKDWTLTWVRRARINTEWRDAIDVPLDEASEAYEVEIWTSGYATLKRTLTGISSPTTSYTSANQVTDFGSNQSTLYLKVYQISATVGRGQPLIASITR